MPQNNLSITNLPLNALRAFETAARHLSFTVAADELGVTQGAVSRQVKNLEDILDRPLFVRQHKQLSLTPQGHELMVGVGEGLAKIAETVAAIGEINKELTIKMLPSIAVRWLIPRIQQFERTHPDIKLNVNIGWKSYRASESHYDAGIIYVSDMHPEHHPPGSMRTDLLYEELMTPVCSPDYLKQHPDLKSPKDLENHNLLSCNCYENDDDWKVWARLQGLENFTPRKQLNFDYLDVALNSAANSQGIVLGDVRLIEADLASGRLVTPLEMPPKKIGAYYFTSRRQAQEHPHLAEFRDWILDQATEPYSLQP